MSCKYLLYWALLFHVHVSPLYSYCYTWHYYFLFMSHWYTDTLFHWIPWFHIFVPSLHGYSVHSYIMFIHYCYMDSPVYMRWLFLYSCCMDHYSYYMDYYSIEIPVFPLHDYFLLLILIYIVTGHVNYWYPMCSVGYLLSPTSPVSRYPLQW